ncbi:MAG: hypothetical protein L0Y60_16800 [Beijerinckiaceae bacterium]|nr:hypothetical protein [Beijerinckiaceae bacterium]
MEDLGLLSLPRQPDLFRLAMMDKAAARDEKDFLPCILDETAHEADEDFHGQGALGKRKEQLTRRRLSST